jgi:hypothetical protein
MLSDSELQEIVRRIDAPDVAGITVTGSVARGQATRYSDVDMKRYVRETPATEAYILHWWDGRLVSVYSGTIEEQVRQFRSPAEAIWALPGVRQARILLDKDGSVAAMQREAESVRWEELREAAGKYVGEQLMGNTEEAHKILGGLAGRGESVTVYALSGMAFNMLNTMAVGRGLLIPSENSYYDIVQDAVGRDHAWTRAFRLAVGLELPPGGEPVYRGRGSAALALYCETVALLGEMLPPQHVPVVENTLRLIREAGYGNG